MSGWAFGYGSLADAAALAAWLGRPPFAPGEAFPCRLRGYRRAWNVARDNGADTGGRPFYIDARTGARADSHVVFVNIRPAPGGSVNGLAFRVTRAERDRLDIREGNYERIDAAAHMDRAPGGPVWVWRGSPAARARYDRAAAAGSAVLARRYYETVETAFAARGRAWLAEYRAGTDAPEVPLADLVRTDWGRRQPRRRRYSAMRRSQWRSAEGRS